MRVMITIIFLHTICVQSPLQDNIYLRVDCYRSFSDPVVFIKLLHYYPSGPLALRVIFSYKRYYVFGGFTPEEVIGQYDFARYDLPCNTSTIFTTGGFFFDYMVVNIKIYLLKEEYNMAHIRYIFDRGFKPGEYKLLDNYQNFVVKLKIIDSKEKYLETQKKLKEIFTHYIQSISQTKGELCIVTDNNLAAIAKLKKGTVLPGGYISALYANDYQRVDGQRYVVYPAFLCHIHYKYHHERVIFITEKNKMGKSFGIIYLKSYINYEANFTRREIEFDNPNFESIDRFEKIPYIYNKIFLFTLFFGPNSKNCSDGSKVTPLLFDDNVEFSEYLCMFVKITTDIKVSTSFITPLSYPCGEEE